MDRADFKSRLAAAFFDAVALVALIVTEIVLMVTIFFGLAVVTPEEGAAPGLLGWQIAFVIVWHLILLGLTALEVFIGKSFGKVVTGLKIAREDGRAAAQGALWLRWAIKWSFLIVLLVLAIPLSLMSRRPPAWTDALSIAVAVLFAGVVICFLFSLGPSRQALYDRWTKTAVFRKHMTGGV